MTLQSLLTPENIAHTMSDAPAEEEPPAVPEETALPEMPANVEEVKNMKSTCIVITNGKGGVGKTTTAVNLAALLAHLGNETLLIDFNSQRNATQGIDKDISPALFDLKPKFSELLTQPNPQNGENYKIDLVDTSVPTYIDKLTLIPGDRELKYVPIRPRSLAAHVALCVSEVDYCVIDTPPESPHITNAALQAALCFPRHHVLAPINYARYTLEGLADVLDELETFMERNRGRIADPDNFYFFFLANVKKAVKKAKKKAHEELQGYEHRLLTTAIHSSQPLEDAQFEGKTAKFGVSADRPEEFELWLIAVEPDAEVMPEEYQAWLDCALPKGWVRVASVKVKKIP